MRRVGGIGLAILATMALALSAYGAELKIAYIDVQRILAESERGKAVKKEIEKRGAEMDKIFRQKKAELQALREELEKQSALLSEEARKEKEKEYQRKMKELERFVRDSREEIRQMEVEKTTALLKSLEKVVKKIGEEQHYTLILEKQRSFILYAPPELDITDEVIKAFDAAKE